MPCKMLPEASCCFASLMSFCICISWAGISLPYLEGWLLRAGTVRFCWLSWGAGSVLIIKKTVSWKHGTETLLVTHQEPKLFLLPREHLEVPLGRSMPNVVGLHFGTFTFKNRISQPSASQAILQGWDAIAICICHLLLYNTLSQNLVA